MRKIKYNLPIVLQNQVDFHYHLYTLSKPIKFQNLNFVKSNIIINIIFKKLLTIILNLLTKKLIIQLIYLTILNFYKLKI